MEENKEIKYYKYNNNILYVINIIKYNIIIYHTINIIINIIKKK